MLATAARTRTAQRQASVIETARARTNTVNATVIEAADYILSATVADEDTRARALDRAILDRVPAAHSVDIAALIRDGIPPVEYIPGDFANRMVYAKGVTVFTGHPDSGKTSFVTRLAIDAMRAGTTVVYFDYENGQEEVARRLTDLGADAELLRPSRFIYRPFPGAPDWDELAALWDAHPDAIGVWDSTRGILGSLGLKENEADDVRQFVDPLVQFSLERSVASILIDHVTKASTKDDPYARGSGDKLAAVQGQWRVEKERPFDEATAGEISLHRKKARSGRLGHEFRFAVGDGEGNLTFRRLGADETPEGRMEAEVIDYLKALHADGKTASMNELEGAVKGGRDKVRDRVKLLAASTHRPVAAVEDGAFTRYTYDPGADNEPARALGF